MDIDFGYAVDVFNNIANIFGNILQLHHGEVSGQSHHANRKKSNIDFENARNFSFIGKVLHPIHGVAYLLHGLIDFIIGQMGLKKDVNLGCAFIRLGFKAPYL